MPSLLIEPPFTTYFDTAGNPLEAGYIYIGTAGLEPSSSPLNVFWDRDLLYPAAQPIRTIGGAPSRDGSAARIYIETADYSIKVEDKNNVLVSSTDVLGAVDADQAFLFPTMLSLLKGTDIADAAALTIPIDGNYFEAPGTTTVTSINTINTNNTIFRIRWMGIRVLTHNATTLDLLGKANITTEVGAESTFIEYSVGNFRMIHYQSSSISPALPMTLDTAQTITGVKTFTKAIVVGGGITENGVTTSKKVVEIGSWDMDTDASSSNIAHGVGDFRKILSISAMIRQDDNTRMRAINFFGTSEVLAGGVDNIGSVNFSLTRFTTGVFDANTDYDLTEYNLDAAAAVDKGGGLVGIPITAHTFLAEDETTIAGTANYNATYIIVSVTANEIVVTATYVAETFAGTDTASWSRGKAFIEYIV